MCACMSAAKSRAKSWPEMLFHSSSFLSRPAPHLNTCSPAAVPSVKRSWLRGRARLGVDFCHAVGLPS